MITSLGSGSSPSGTNSFAVAPTLMTAKLPETVTPTALTCRRFARAEQTGDARPNPRPGNWCWCHREHASRQGFRRKILQRHINTRLTEARATRRCTKQRPVVAMRLLSTRRHSALSPVRHVRVHHTRAFRVALRRPWWPLG